MDVGKTILLPMDTKFAFVLMEVEMPRYGLSLHSSIRIAS